MDNLSLSRSRRRRSPVRKRVVVALVLFVVILLGIGLFKVGKYLVAVLQVPLSQEVNLKETPEKRVNLLILGVGGGNHDGPNLADTIIFTSIDPKQKQVSLVSLPRDLWVPQISAKVNQAYVAGEDKTAGTGLKTAKALIGNILGQQIDYVLKIDFQGFEKAVDTMGGLSVDVARTFDDYAYPVAGQEANPCGNTDDQIASLSAEIASGSATELDAFPCRYEHLHFTKGKTTMDGKTALKYVRSRHAVGPEGSDFARSQRQAKVISAFKEKLFSAGTVLNPAKIISLVNILQGSIEMDIKDDEYDDFVRLANKMKDAKISSITIDEGDGEEDRLGILINPPPDPANGNQWILAPRIGVGEYGELQEYVSCKINGSNCLVGENGITTPTPKPTAMPSGTKIKSN